MLAEGVVDQVRRDHKAASDQRNCHFRQVGRQAVAPPCAGGDADQPARHQQQDALAPVPAVSREHREAADGRHQDSQRAVEFLFRGNVVRPDRRERKHNWSQDAVNKAGGRGDDTEPVCAKRECVTFSGHGVNINMRKRLIRV